MIIKMRIPEGNGDKGLVGVAEALDRICTDKVLAEKDDGGRVEFRLSSTGERLVVPMGGNVHWHYDFQSNRLAPFYGDDSDNPIEYVLGEPWTRPTPTRKVVLEALKDEGVGSAVAERAVEAAPASAYRPIRVNSPLETWSVAAALMLRGFMPPFVELVDHQDQGSEWSMTLRFMDETGEGHLVRVLGGEAHIVSESMWIVGGHDRLRIDCNGDIRGMFHAQGIMRFENWPA